VESKLDRMTKPSLNESAPRVRGGWLKSKHYEKLPSKASNPQQILVALYGMSHTQCLWKAMQKLDINKRYLIRGFMAAGAPPNWALAEYELDRKRCKSDVAILGIMTEGVPLVSSTTGMTAYFDIAYPYTFPRYKLAHNRLIVRYPPFIGAKGYLYYFYHPSKWMAYKSWLAKNDKYYDPVLFKRSVLDKSAYFRLLRRAYAQKSNRSIYNSVYGENGYNENSEEVAVVRGIVKRFAKLARKDGTIPIIYVVNTQGQSDKLYRLLKPAFDDDHIPFLSTHLICPPDDPSVFMKTNSHFTAEKDLELANEMIKIIEREVEKTASGPSSQVIPGTSKKYSDRLNETMEIRAKLLALHSPKQRGNRLTANHYALLECPQN